MSNKLSEPGPDTHLERELERERHERLLHDEQRAGLAVDDEFRTKDVREQRGAVTIRRPASR